VIPYVIYCSGLAGCSLLDITYCTALTLLVGRQEEHPACKN